MRKKTAEVCVGWSCGTCPACKERDEYEAKLRNAIPLCNALGWGKIKGVRI